MEEKGKRPMMSPAEYAELMAEAPAQRAAEPKEAHMENLYGWICRQACPEKAVADLADYALLDLDGWLVREGCMSGIPALIQGLITVEMAKRFMSNAKTQRTPRGAEVEGGPVS